MTGLEIAAGIAATVAAGSTVYSIQQQREAQKEQKKASRMESRRASLQNARDRRRAAAQAVMQRSQVEAQAAAQTGSTTGTSTTLGAISSQAAGAQSFQQTQEGLGAGIIRRQNRANQRMGRASTAQAIGNLSYQLGAPTLAQAGFFAGRGSQ